MSRTPIQTISAALALALILVAGPAWAGRDRKLTIALGDAEGDGISLSLSGKWLNEAVLDSIGESIECDGTTDRDTRRVLLHLRERGENSSYTLRDGDEITRARRRGGRLELRKHEEGEQPTRVVMPWAIGECMLGNGRPMRTLGDRFEMTIEKDGELRLKIE